MASAFWNEDRVQRGYFQSYGRWSKMERIIPTKRICDIF